MAILNGMALPTEELLTTSEVATLARVTPATVSAWARTKFVPAKRVNRQWLFRRADVLQALGLEEAS